MPNESLAFQPKTGKFRRETNCLRYMPGPEKSQKSATFFVEGQPSKWFPVQAKKKSVFPARPQIAAARLRCGSTAPGRQ